MKRTALTGLAALFVVASPAYADVAFVGQSRASPQLKRDVLTAIVGYAKSAHACNSLTTVESAPLGEKYEPKTLMYRVAAPQHLYERWVADLCGTKRVFLVALWPSPKGGADYKVVEVPPGTDP
jgi:hypothetical protein